MSLLAGPFLAPPLKRSEKVDLKSPFRNFIFSTYGQDADSYNGPISELQALRNLCCSGTMDKHESSIDAVTKFYDQLVAIEAKLPVGEGQIPVKYLWYDCFNRKDSFFSSSSVKQALCSGAYERVCVLFNLAAINSIVSSAQNLETDVGLKLACKAFPLAAAMFQHLRDQVFAQLSKVPTPDLGGDSVVALSTLMLAQGQECFFHKATSDNMKSAVITKVAAQASDYYGDAMRALDNSAVRGQWDKTWIPIVTGKQSYFLGMADYYDSLALKDGKKFGDQISRLRHASQMLQQAARQGEGNLNVTKALDRVKRDLETAEKENTMIYNAIIPEYNAMPILGRAAVSKIPPMPTHPISGSTFQDAFSGLVPLEVHQAASEFEAKRKSYSQQLCNRAKEATHVMNSELAGMNLPAALEDSTGTEVPPSLLEKSQAILTAGGWQPLKEKIDNLPDNLQRNMDIVNDMAQSLDAEEQEDDKLRNRFKAKWSRTESKKLTENFRKEIAKYSNFLTTARSADKQVQEKFQAHLGSMQVLCSSPEDLKARLPSGGPSAQSGSQTVLELQNLMAQWVQLRTEREQMEAQVDGATYDIQSRFLSALTSDGAINEEATSAQILEELFGSYREQLDASLQRQEELLFRVKAANEIFEREKSSGGAASQREEMLKSLAAAYDVFSELNANITEGTKFYADLTGLLMQLQQKVNDLVFTRNTEKEDAIKELQSNIAGAEHAPAPAQPSYQQPATNTPPTRPPPPTAAPRRQAPSPAAAAPAPTVSSGFAQQPAPAVVQQPPVATPARPAAYTPPQPSIPPQGYGAYPGHGAPPPAQAGYAPPPAQAGYAPPPAQAGYAPPPAQAGYAPPPAQAGYAPPQGYGAYPTVGGYYAPPGAQPYGGMQAGYATQPPPGSYPPQQYPGQPQPAYPTQPGYPQQPPANPGYPQQPPAYQPPR